jgi:hypothetical protein
MSDRQRVQGCAQEGNFQGVAPVIPYRPIGAIRGGAYSKHGTQDESEDKRTNDGEDGHRQHFRHSRERPWSSMSS